MTQETRPSYYITTPIFYPNDNLHLGHTYTTIVADVLKRFKEIQGYDAYMVTGTDEHGQKIQEAAENAGKEPLEYVDAIVETAKDLWNKLDIEVDTFQRSTDPKHVKNVQDIFTKLYEKGEIYKDIYKGHYCTPCESFWTDAQLDQGMCPDCGREVEYQEEESYFFRLSKYEKDLLDLYEKNPNFIQPEAIKNEMINNFFKDGLTDLSVSRTSVDWGVKVPFDKKHTIYVWIDALSCYLTAVGYGTDQEKFDHHWPAAVHLVGKEITRFHTIIWPAILMALEIDLPDQVFGHGWILFDDGKMSKSKGNVVYAEPIIERYGVDALKYFMLREFTFGQDGSYTNEKLIKRINFDLANDLGNLVSRSIQMVSKYRDGIVPEAKVETEFDQDLVSQGEGVREEVEKEIDKFSFSTALEAIWSFVRRTNKYIDQTEPWILAKGEDQESQEKLDTVLYKLIESIRIIGQLIEPFMEETSKKIAVQLNFENQGWESASDFGLYPAGNKVERSKENLFQRLDVEEEVEALAEDNQKFLEEKTQGGRVEEQNPGKAEIAIEDFDKLELKVGEIISCEPHPDADRLLVSQVNIGTETRQIVSGIKKHYSPEDLVGKKIVVLTNLKPTKLRGVLSEGMVLAASDDRDLSLISPLKDMDPGTEIS